MWVPLVAATPRPGFSNVMLRLVGAVKFSPGNSATIFGYHSFTTGSMVCVAQTCRAGAAETSSVISYLPSAVWVTICAGEAFGPWTSISLQNVWLLPSSRSVACTSSSR